MNLTPEQSLLYDKWRQTLSDGDRYALYNSLDAFQKSQWHEAPTVYRHAAISNCPPLGEELSGSGAYQYVPYSPLHALLGSGAAYSGAFNVAPPTAVQELLAHESGSPSQNEADKIVRAFDWDRATDLPYLDWFFGKEGPAAGANFPLEVTT